MSFKQGKGFRKCPIIIQNLLFTNVSAISIEKNHNQQLNETVSESSGIEPLKEREIAANLVTLSLSLSLALALSLFFF